MPPASIRKRLPVGVLYIGGPALLDEGDHAFGERNVIELLGRFAALGEGPAEELQRFASSGGVLRLFWQKDEGRRSDGPGLRSRLIRQDLIKPGSLGPVGVGGGGLEALGRRADNLSVLVDHFHEGQLILLGVGVFDIADRALGVGDRAGDALIALGADSTGHSTAEFSPTLAFQSAETLER